MLTDLVVIALCVIATGVVFWVWLRGVKEAWDNPRRDSYWLLGLSTYALIVSVVFLIQILKV